MTAGERFIVPGERHVERLAGEGASAETRTALRARLAMTLLPDQSFADERECRLLLALALDEGARVPLLPARLTSARAAAREAAARRQLDLFGAAPVESARGPRSNATPATADERDPLLETLRSRGGASWSRMVDALATAIGHLRSRLVTRDHLLLVAGAARGLTGARARTLATAMHALDEKLAVAKLTDERLVGPRLADAIRGSSPDVLMSVLGTNRLRARFLFAWEPADLVWWRALDEMLAPVFGHARIVLPIFDRALEGSRERDPLELLGDDLARALDAPPEHDTIAPVLGDLTFAPSSTGSLALERVMLERAAEPAAQAELAVRAIRAALDGGASLERIAVVVPSSDERTLAPLRRKLEEESIVTFEARGAPPTGTPVVSAAFLALEVGETLERTSVARLLQSGYVDGGALAPEATSRADAARALDRLARKLRQTATAAGEDAPSRFVSTATAPPARPDPRETDAHRALLHAMAERLATVLFRAEASDTRLAHVHHARRLWSMLGLGSRAGRGGLRTFATDDAPREARRAERAAIARDARAWDGLMAMLDLYESTVVRAGGSEVRVSREVFQKELGTLLDEHGARPGAGRAGAVRIARLADVPGDELDLLVILDANEGLLPRDPPGDALVSDAVWTALARVGHERLGGAVVTAPSVDGRRARELTQLAAAADGAARTLFISLREDASGAPIAPSPVVTSLERAGVPVGAADAGPAPRHFPPDLATRVARERTRESFFLDPTRRTSDVVGTLDVPAAAAPLLRYATGGAARPLAVTALERFARCPFMGYAHAVLQVREAERHDELPDAREEGTVVHDALAAAFDATRDAWPVRPRDRESILTRGLAAAEGVLERWQGHAPLRAIYRLRVRDTVRAVLEAALADEEWDFMLAEQPFGARTGETWPPHRLHAADEELTLRGTIDRVDRARGGGSFRVVDYKRSKNTVRSSLSALGETALQVPLYARVTERALERPTTGTYLPFQPRDVRDAKIGPKAQKRMDELLVIPEGERHAPIDQRALGLVIGTRRGRLAPIPATESECLHCAVSGGCRKPRFAMAPLEDDEGEGG